MNLNELNILFSDRQCIDNVEYAQNKTHDYSKVSNFNEMGDQLSQKIQKSLNNCKIRRN